jgi:hypothetical protein
MTARGIRNNNPGNIDRTDIQWQGMAPDQSSDPRFIVFIAPVWGLRAIARTLLTYSRDNVDTVRGAISRWAPPSENNTLAYVNAVSRAAGVAPDDKIDMTNPGTLMLLVKAIVAQENGQQPYPISLIAQAVTMALSPSAKV